MKLVSNLIQFQKVKKEEVNSWTNVSFARYYGLKGISVLDVDGKTALDKVQYYLAHEEERIKIARSGYERIKKDFSFPDRIAKMFSTI